MTIRSAVMGLLFAMGGWSGHAQEALRSSSTTLSVKIGNARTAAGIVVTLAARVSSGQQPITRGLVKFCDADAPRCDGISQLGTAQLDSRGQAAIQMRLGPGERHLKAIFSGTPRSTPPFSGSSSATQTVIIGGNVATVQTGERR